QTTAENRVPCAANLSHISRFLNFSGEKLLLCGNLAGLPWMFGQKTLRPLKGLRQKQRRDLELWQRARPARTRLKLGSLSRKIANQHSDNQTISGCYKIIACPCAARDERSADAIARLDRGAPSQAI